MPEPASLSLGALLSIAVPAAVKGVGKGVGVALGKEAIAAWRKERRVQNASKTAAAATARRHRGWPGVEQALRTWAESPAFDNLILDAALGKTERLSASRAAESFTETGGAGWSQARAVAVATTFLSELFGELAKGPDGQALRLRLAEARERQASHERSQIHEVASDARDAATGAQVAAEEVALNTRDLGPRLDDIGGGIEELLSRLAPEGRLPEILQSAVQDGVFDEITRHLVGNQPTEALALADRFSDRIETALQGDGDRYEAALRPYRQRLLFAAANAASRLLDSETARDRAQAALALGPVDPRLHPQAVQATFNATLPDSLRQITTSIPEDAPERERADALLAYLDADWDAAVDKLAALDDPALRSLRVEAELARLDPRDPDQVGHVAGLIEAEEAEATSPLDAVAVARHSVGLLDRVVRENTPTAFDRRPLTDSVLQRVRAAVDAVPPDTALHAHALSVVGTAGQVLLDGPLLRTASEGIDALSDEVRALVVFAYEEEPSAEDIQAAVAEGRIPPAQAALLTARREIGDGDRAAAIVTLREALFQTHGARDRVPILDRLVEALRADGRDDEAGALLATAPVPEADRWLLSQRPGHPLNLDAAASLPPDPRVLRHVADYLLSETQPLGRDEDGDVIRPTSSPTPNPGGDGRPSPWTRRLVETLPSRSSRGLHAEALLHDAEFEALLDAVHDLDPESAPRPAELHAFALQGLGQLHAAARLLTETSADFPDLERLAINAAAIWLELRKGQEALDVLEPFIEADTDTIGALVNYSTALREAAPDDREAASRAFDLLSRAYEREPSPRLAAQVWAAARAAGRETDGGPYFHAMTAGAAPVEIRTAEDARRALTEPQAGGFTAYTGDMSAFVEVFAEHTRKERDARDQLSRASSAHALSYADTFRASGHAWENWTRWTLEAERRGGSEGYAVLTDWPSSSHVFGRRLDPAPAGIYADLSALLTLSVLDRQTAADLVAAAAPVYVAADTLGGLSNELDRLQSAIAVTGTVGETLAVERFEGTDAVVPYDEAVEAAAPDAPDLGAARVDLGVAAYLGGRYVSDLERAAPAEGLAVRSATLLHTLHLDGIVDRDSAERAAQDYPSTFGGWAEATPLDALPSVLVFDRFALAAWTASGLADALGARVRVGPWAWSHLLGDVRQREAATLAYQRLKTTLDVLQGALDADQLRTLETPEPPSDGSTTTSPVEAAAGSSDEETMEDVWREALRSVRAAQEHDLQLWADDRFYPLLLWLGGPVIDGPTTEAVLESLTSAGDLPLPVPTLDLAARLARDGDLPDTVVRRLAGRLFDLGYRPAHPLALADALNRFATPSAPPLRGRARHIADAVRSIPSYLPDDIAPLKRQGFARVAAAEVAEQGVVLAWTYPGLGDDQRRVLADAFLDAVEAVFAEQSPDPDAPRSDRTRLLFWRSLASSLFTTPFEGEDAADRQDAALRWLGEAAALRPDPHKDIVRLLEDNASSAVTLTPDVETIAATLAGADRDDDPQEAHARAVGQFAFRALVPLLGSRLVDSLDPLLRRTVGTLARLDRRGHIDSHLGVTHSGQELSTTVTGEEEEDAALGLLRRVLQGDEALADRVGAVDLRFTYHRPPPDDWVEAGIPADARVPIRVHTPLVTLLWADAPDVLPVVVHHLLYHLAHLDPPLALRLLDARDALLGDDEEARDAARDSLALDLLLSGFYELQRDLGHAVWRLRDWPADRLSRFLGWLGPDDAQRIAGLDAGATVLGSVVVPQNHFMARQLLTDTFDDADAVLAAVAATVAGEDPPPIPDLVAWVANRRETAETADDPFVAAYALRHVLLALRAGADVPGTTEWVGSYLATALASPAPLAADPALRHLDARRRLAQASLQLAAFVSFGPHHLEAHADEDDPLHEWLDRTWLLASRFTLALLALHRDLGRAAAEAEQTVRDLGLDMTSARVLDTFDPFTFANTDDLGQTLTLFALHSSLDATASAVPGWWSPAIADQVSSIARAPSPHGDPEDELGDRFGLGGPLRQRALARAVLAALTGGPSDDDQPIEEATPEEAPGDDSLLR